MKKFIFLTLSLALSCTMLACSESEESHSFKPAGQTFPEPGPVVCCTPKPWNEPPKVHKIYGELAEEFYANLMYKRLGQCPRANYRFLQADPVLIGQDQFGRRVEGTIKLAIYPDGTYEVLYSEITFRKWTESGIAEIYYEQFKGVWKIEGKDMILENLGKGYGMRVLGKRKLFLTVERDLIREGLKGKLLKFSVQITDYAPMKLTDCN